jgi:hypothetical protein
LRTFIGQRIDPRDGVAERAVGIDEAVHTRLERTFPDFRRGLRCCGGRAVAVIQIAELEPFEKGRPARIEGFRILLPTPVIFLEQIEVQASGERWAHGGSICKASAGRAS